MSDPQTLPGKLASEISRVTALIGQYEEAGRLTGSPQSVAPAIFLMRGSLKRAIAAAGSPDVKEQIVAVQELESWEDQ